MYGRSGDKPAKTLAIGGKLRTARDRRGYTLREASGATKISAAYLDALEQNDLTKLPAPIFVRGFLRSYCQFLHIDPAPLVLEYEMVTGAATHNNVDTTLFEPKTGGEKIARMLGNLLNSLTYRP